MATLHLRIVTPDGETYSDDVDSVVLPGVEGEMDVLPRHAALMAELAPGELRAIKGGQPFALAIGQGLAEINQEHVNVLTESAAKEGDIDEAETQKAIERAQAALSDKSMIGEELEATQAALARSIAALNFKRKRRTH